MHNYKQEVSYKVHLRKAKKSVNFILILFFIILLPTLAFGRLEQSSYIQAISFVALFISARTIFKYPMITVITLGFMILFYLHGWYNFLFKSNLSAMARDFLFYFILILRMFTTLIVLRGFYSAIKGVNGKEQFEKKFGTLDEDEM